MHASLFGKSKVIKALSGPRILVREDYAKRWLTSYAANLEETSNVLECSQSQYLTSLQISVLIFLTVTRLLKPDELHGILEELRTFFDLLPENLLNEQESHTAITHLQSLLSGDSQDKYSEVANRLSKWTKTFLT